ncbi:hypothetical protein D4T97_008690 [Siminovitchia acidinfaciens]|uniref:Lipoprotein n=1 Tax=Siminovitchia acidinfaciens TaxID=2321395 RepID=A0A429Y2D4_9BACI|nr:hypothetical protein [Siminovitchia acidinfaciens]RST75316.1 hypothetical protein D4T97_008690 [Siminovitchia acidinfaciens]
MKKMKCLFIFLLTAAMLAACGTTKKEQNTANEKDNNGAVSEENAQKDSGEEAETDSDDGKQQNDPGEAADNGTDKIRLMEKNLTYQLNDETKEETAFLKESDNQDYSLYVLPDYELTGEEPRKDVLYLKENDTLFMRIELLPKDANLDNEIETVKSQLESVSSDIKESKPEGHEWLKDAAGFTADNGNDRVSAYLIPQSEWLLKLTIFTPVKESAEDPFLKMAETIEEK